MAAHQKGTAGGDIKTVRGIPLFLTPPLSYDALALPSSLLLLAAAAFES